MFVRCTISGLTEIRDFYRLSEIHAESLIRAISAGSQFSSQDIDDALKFNKELRQLFFGLGAGRQSEFERRYSPLGGWSGYWDRSSNELHLIEEWKSICAQDSDLLI